MPTYSYICDGCGESFEIEQRIVEDPIKKCILCGKPKAKRQIVSGNFILKGGGWYSDGYGSGGGKAKASAPGSAKADKAESTSTSDSSASKSEKSEPSTKSESPAPKSGESKASAASS
jgi:putative FmdB family regulatory protein